MAQHRGGCRQDLRMFSGFADRGQDFIDDYELDIQFDITCLGCCLDYLITDRRYTQVVGPFDRVHFTLGNTPNVSSFVRVPGGGGRRGQIATLKDLNMGIPTKRPFHQSRTYQLYGQTGGLSMGAAVTARMESSAIDVATAGELSSIYVNYADAALVELYRSSRDPPLPSLDGFCNLVRERTIDMGGLKLETQ